MTADVATLDTAADLLFFAESVPISGKNSSTTGFSLKTSLPSAGSSKSCGSRLVKRKNLSAPKEIRLATRGKAKTTHLDLTHLFFL